MRRKKLAEAGLLAGCFDLLPALIDSPDSAHPMFTRVYVDLL